MSQGQGHTWNLNICSFSKERLITAQDSSWVWPWLTHNWTLFSLCSSIKCSQLHHLGSGISKKVQFPAPSSFLRKEGFEVDLLGTQDIGFLYIYFNNSYRLCLHLINHSIWIVIQTENLFCPLFIKRKEIYWQRVIFIVKNMEKTVGRQLKCIHISDDQTSLHFTLNKVPWKYKNDMKT